MLAEIGIESFKSYRSARLPLAPLTLLIGANASGKSNAIEGLRLLSRLAQDHKLSSIRYDIQDSDDIVRGTVADLPYQGGSRFGFTCRLAFPEGFEEAARENDVSPEVTRWPNLRLGIALKGDELRVVEEKVFSNAASAPLYELVEPANIPSHDVKVAYDNFASAGRKPQITCTDQRPMFLQLQSPAGFGDKHRKSQRIIPDVGMLYETDPSDMLFLDPVPAHMRGYSFPSDEPLKGDGGNLSGVLHGLWQDEGKRRRLLHVIASLPEQDIAGLDFATTSRGEVMVQLVETFGKKRRTIDAPLLSDGTLRVLAVAAALMSAPWPSMVIIEEIDNGVHPSRADLLLRTIREVAEERRLRVLLTTHNPALMDALPDASLKDVVFCYRDPDEGDSRLVRLDDLERAPSLLAQGSLGDLVTRGMLDRFVKERASPQERKRKNEAWLAEIKQLAS